MLRIAPVALILFGMSCSSRDGAPPVAPTPPVVAVADAAVAADAADGEVAGRRLTAWLAMLNDGTRDEIIAFREREIAEELRKGLPDPDEILRFRAMTGGFDVGRVEDKTPPRASVLVRERSSDQIARAIVEVEAAPPHRITKVDLLAIVAPE